MGLFSNESNGYLGVDIGKSGIKLVELKKEGDKAVLSGYGFSENVDVLNNPNWYPDVKKTAALLAQVVEKAKLTSKSAIVSLPAYSIFSSIINLVNVDKKHIDEAIYIETKKVLPVPIEEVTLETRVIESRIEDSKEYLRIFVTAVPHKLISKYQEIFKEAKINLHSLEPEIFAGIRSLIGKDKSSYMLVELGASTTSLSIVERGVPVVNRSLDFGGSVVTQLLAENLSVHATEAEQMKFDMGINSLGGNTPKVPQVIADSLSPVINEIKYMISLYESKDNHKIEKIILTGGSSLLVNLPNYFEKILDITTIIGDPWTRVSYSMELEPLLKELGPRLSVAVGLALHRLE